MTFFSGPKLIVLCLHNTNKCINQLGCVVRDSLVAPLFEVIYENLITPFNLDKGSVYEIPLLLFFPNKSSEHIIFTGEIYVLSCYLVVTASVCLGLYKNTYI